MTDKYFKKVNAPSEHVSKFFTEDRLSKLDWLNVPGYQGIEVPRPIYMKEKFFQALDEKYGVSGCAILKFSPMIAYTWHNDSDRNATINMLLNPWHHSHSMFGENGSEWHKEIIELVYEQDHFYLFNTQHPHEVINLDHMRYLFTARITADPTYEELLEWAVANEWVS
jgi:hypothetical protein